jgi:hypothetical protein
VRRTWKNTSEQTVKIQTSFRVQTGFVPERFLIPCVSVNGNEFGRGGEPKGLTRDGKKWIFAYDRTSLPACTVTENAACACAVFASSESDVSVQSSCSLTKNDDGTFVQEMIGVCATKTVILCLTSPTEKQVFDVMAEKNKSCTPFTS